MFLVSDGVQDKALAGGEAQAESPALPANLPAADFEARALGLDDLERLEIVSQRPDAIGSIGARTRRQRHRAQILHPQYRHVVEVHDGVEAMDRLGIGVVVRPLAIVEQGPRHPAARVLGGRERADPPWLHTHLPGIGDATTLKSGPDPRVGPRHDPALDAFRRGEWRTRIRYGPPGQN